ncbi:MAG: hypothetical protein ABSF32_07250, partial [Ignavibacteria bacterium]
SIELPAVLRELEEIDFISIIRSGDTIKRVDLRIPEFRSGYTDLGERWKLIKPSEIEEASILMLNTLLQGPKERENFVKSIGIGSSEESIIFDVMESGSLVDTRTVDGKPMIYTPLAVDCNPIVYLQWAKKFPGEVGNVLEILKNYQGLPLQELIKYKNKALNEAILTGVLMPVEVNGATGTQRFVFAPHGNLTQEESVVMDKARAILSCVRYGQNYAKNVPIKYPRLILERLRSDKRFKKGHPDLITQYGLLVEKLIGRIVDEGGQRYNLVIYDTAENLKALDIALEMLQHGETPGAKIDLEAQNALLSSSGYQGPIPTRVILSKTIKRSDLTSAEIIKQMSKLVRGIS